MMTSGLTGGGQTRTWKPTKQQQRVPGGERIHAAEEHVEPGRVDEVAEAVDRRDHGRPDHADADRERDERGWAHPQHGQHEQVEQTAIPKSRCSASR